MRIALLSYRTKEHGGGQGVYVRQLSAGLADLGHSVELFSGPPYPETLDPRVRLTKVPSLDLFRESDPLRIPRREEFTDLDDVVEYAVTTTGQFAEPLAFSRRIARIMRTRAHDFDVVHDNQCLGSGLLELVDHEVPLVATIHHPITRDRRVEVDHAPWWRKPSVARWYSFVRMQARVARRIPHLIGVSSLSVADTVTDFRLSRDQFRVIPLGADIDLFSPTAAQQRVPGRIVCVASADNPLKGVHHLLEAVARLRDQHPDLHLQLVCRLDPASTATRRIRELGIADIVHTRSDLTDQELASLLASAEVMAVPSLYEGFSLPTVEAMACGTPLVASRAGALPEVVGEDGFAGLLVPPADVASLTAGLDRVLSDASLRARMSINGRHRATTRFSWSSVAARTAEVYIEAIDEAVARRRRKG